MTPKEEWRNLFINHLKKKECELIDKLGLKRIKTQKKIFYCENGKMPYRFIYVKTPDGRSFSPLREYLGIGKYQNMSEDFKSKLRMKASRTSYQKAVEDIYDSFNFKMSKKTLNRLVIEGKDIKPCSEPSQGQNVLLVDGTKVRNGKKGHHEVLAAMSLNAKTNSVSLAEYGINVKPSDLASKIDVSKYVAIVGDGEAALHDAFILLPFHLCHQHAPRTLSYLLWHDKEKMPKKKREKCVKRLVALLCTLQNSTEKFWTDKDNDRLNSRIEKTTEGIRSLVTDLYRHNVGKAANFLSRHCENLVTAARLALKGYRIPWTTNHIERLMQEIGNRTKKKGMNWTQKGLRAILDIVLKRYFTPKDKRNYKNIMRVNRMCSKQVVKA